VSVARFAFQACSFSHSDISPFLNQRFASGLQIIAHATRVEGIHFDHVSNQQLASGRSESSFESCQTAELNLV
jgi:hypothetical protein